MFIVYVVFPCGLLSLTFAEGVLLAMPAGGSLFTIKTVGMDPAILKGIPSMHYKQCDATVLKTPVEAAPEIEHKVNKAMAANVVFF
jgi:hypothetical protein